MFVQPNFSLDCRPPRDFPSLSRPTLSPYGIIFSRSYPRGYPVARYTLRGKRTSPLRILQPRSVFRVYIRPVEFHFDSKLKTRHPLRVRPVFTGGKVSSRHVNNVCRRGSAESKNGQRRVLRGGEEEVSERGGAERDGEWRVEVKRK